MTYYNFFTSLNFNIGAMIGNSLASMAGWRFFGNQFQMTGCIFQPFGFFQYPQFNSMSMPPLNMDTAFFTPQISNTYTGLSVWSSPQNNYFSVNSQTIGDSFSYSLPVTYTEPSIKPAKKKSKRTKNPAIENFGSEATEAAKRMVENATYYVGKVNNDSEGNRLFSPKGRAQAWCADFVTYITRKSYGDKFPSDFGKAVRKSTHYGSSSVQGIKYWAEDHDCYNELPANDSQKASFISQNIKPGDIMIELRNGKSHTGVVINVNSDGSFDTVEGNCSDSVKKCHYKATSKTLSGFVSMSKYA